MKKLTISIGLVVTMLSAKSQDTIETMITPKKVYFFYSNDSIPYKQYLHNDSIFFNVKSNEVICVHLYDKKLKLRKFTTIYSDYRSKTIHLFNSKDNKYCSPIGPFKLEISKSQ